MMSILKELNIYFSHTYWYTNMHTWSSSRSTLCQCDGDILNTPTSARLNAIIIFYMVETFIYKIDM